MNSPCKSTSLWMPHLRPKRKIFIVANEIFCVISFVENSLTQNIFLSFYGKEVKCFTPWESCRKTSGRLPQIKGKLFCFWNGRDVGISYSAGFCQIVSFLFHPPNPTELKWKDLLGRNQAELNFHRANRK